MDRRTIYFYMAGALLIVLLVLSITVGSIAIPLGRIFQILQNPHTLNSPDSKIIWQFRLPQSLTAVLAGASLSVSGLQMQTLFQNPLAGPFVLGISAGASLGVAVATGWSGGHNLSVVSSAGLGSALVILILLLSARWLSSPTSLLVLGLLLGYAVNGIVSILFQFTNSEQLRRFINWTLGNFSGVTWEQMPILFTFVIIGLGMAIGLAKPLNTLLLGEEQARSLGTALVRLRLLVMVNSALLVGAITAFCGPIAFIGVTVPHLCRLLWGGSDHRLLVGGVILIGSIVALSADLGTKILGGGVILPLNALTALVGIPGMIWIIGFAPGGKHRF